MILSAYLRTYLPHEGERPHGELVGPDPSAALRGNDHFLWTEAAADEAYSVTWQDQTFVCPRYPRLRMLEGMLAFSNAFPDTALIPESEVVIASEELTRLRDQSSSIRSHILTSPWHVPVRWFVAFFNDEREIYEREGSISIRYRTLLGDARKRVARAVQIVDGAGFDSGVVRQVEGLEMWLDGFPPNALLELDYAGVAGLFSEGDLVIDESAADAAASLKALELGNFEEAGAFYATIARRWGPVQSLAFAN